MGKDYHVFFVLSKNCPSCNVFLKNEFQQIKKHFGKVSFLSLNETRQLVDTEFIKSFQKDAASNRLHPQMVAARWTPTIGVVTMDSWNDKTGPLIGEVYGGKLLYKGNVNSFVRDKSQFVKLTASSIIDWVENTVKTSDSFANYQDINTLIYGYAPRISFNERDVSKR